MHSMNKKGDFVKFYFVWKACFCVNNCIFFHRISGITLELKLMKKK